MVVNPRHQEWDTTFATDHLGPFMLTEVLMPYSPNDSNVIFVSSGVEDPQRKPSTIVEFRGGRYISAEVSARGEWELDGSKLSGADAYPTSKQAISLPSWHSRARHRGFGPTPSNRD
jgi:NAD(P)-dependent dehydrogenase (short-subunit alcohol dehydrogenase family)